MDRTIVIGAGMAGLAAATALAAKGEEVLLLEAKDYPGGKMREVASDSGPIDSGPTVFTMKYVFDRLFDLGGTSFDSAVPHKKASVLARHAWDDTGTFDLFASREQSTESIASFFDAENADGFSQFCKDASRIYELLKDTFIGASRPNPIELARRIGLSKPGDLLALKPLHTLWSALGKYFPDPRLRQLFGRYATYVGSSPFNAPATLMLIAHVEQEGVWLIDGGMHALAQAMQTLAVQNGATVRRGCPVEKLITTARGVEGIVTREGEILAAKHVVFCGDVSALTPQFIGHDRSMGNQVPAKKRSLSAITWSMDAKCSGIPLHRHNVFFSNDYRREFNSIFKEHAVPDVPTTYICAQDRHDDPGRFKGGTERLLCLINAPAIGDRITFTPEKLETCQKNMMELLANCGLTIQPITSQITQPSDFERLFPGSGGALYGRASHGWTASFARPGAATSIPGLFLAGGSVHPGPGVPMATLSGILAAEAILKAPVLT